MLKKMNNPQQILKAEDLQAENKLFDILRDDRAATFKIIPVALDQKGTVSCRWWKDGKLVKNLKRKLSQEEVFEKRKACKLKSV